MFSPFLLGPFRVECLWMSTLGVETKQTLPTVFRLDSFFRRSRRWFMAWGWKKQKKKQSSTLWKSSIETIDLLSTGLSDADEILHFKSGSRRIRCHRARWHSKEETRFLVPTRLSSFFYFMVTYDFYCHLFFSFFIFFLLLFFLLLFFFFFFLYFFLFENIFFLK